MICRSRQTKNKARKERPVTVMRRESEKRRGKENGKLTLNQKFCSLLLNRAFRNVNSSYTLYTTPFRSPAYWSP